MIRGFVQRLSRSALFMQVSTAFAFLSAVTSVAAVVGITLSYLGTDVNFEVRLGADLTTSRPGDRIFLTILTVFFGVLSFGVLARDRHIRKPGIDIKVG